MEPLDPYAAPQADVDAGPRSLGSLAQSARGKELGQARMILFVIGVLTLAGNGFFLYNTPKEVEQVIRQTQLDPGQVEETRQAITYFCYAVYGGLALLGVLFFVFGLIIKSYPVPITITSLVLYILSNLGIAFLNPMSLVSGIIIKIFIVYGLFRAIKAARAYESDTRTAAAAGFAIE